MYMYIHTSQRTILIYSKPLLHDSIISLRGPPIIYWTELRDRRGSHCTAWRRSVSVTSAMYMCIMYCACFLAESQPELNVLSKYEYDITLIISQNLTYFSIKFVGSAFITRVQSSDIRSMNGVENLEKASRLLNYAYANLGIIRSPEEREKWFKCFLSHFESAATYQELVATLREEYRKGMWAL